LPDISASAFRLAIPTNHILDGMDSATERSFDAAISRLDSRNVQIDRRPFRTLDVLKAALGGGSLAAAEAFAWHRDLLATRRDGYDPRVADRIAPGGELSAADYMRLLADRHFVQRLFAEESLGYDAWLMPTVVIAPPPLSVFSQDDEYWRLNGLILRNTAVINFLDGCAISLPCHAPGDPPAGLMLAAGALQDQRLFTVAKAVETALGHQS
jgi:aspartyl-tRNA(Asn)/glutamyl-tRNA(Gln) amidotransferase subunit A